MIGFGLSNCFVLVCVGFYLGFCQQDHNASSGHPSHALSLSRRTRFKCSSHPCMNGGQCSDVSNDYTCACLAGYAGTDCEIDVYECGSNPCKVEGSSCEDLVNGYVCACEPDYTSPKSIESRLYPCEVKRKKSELTSPNGTYHVDIQEDGNIVLYHEKGHLSWKWHAHTPGYAEHVKLILDVDGDLKLLKDTILVWNTGTQGQQIAYAEVTDDGLFRLVSTNGSVAWERTPTYGTG